MAIIETNYEETSALIWEKLAEHGKEVVAEHFDYDEEDYEEKENIQIALSFKEEELILGRIAGVIDFDNNSLNIEAFAIEKEARGKGIGKQLLKALEDRALVEGCNMAFVDTLSFSAPDFYKHEGYTLLGLIDNYPEPGIAKYWFYKRL